MAGFVTALIYLVGFLLSGLAGWLLGGMLRRKFLPIEDEEEWEWGTKPKHKWRLRHKRKGHPEL